MPKREISYRKLRKNSIGDLRERVSLETRQILAPNFNSSAFSQTYTQVVETWAKIETVDQNRYFNGVALDPKISHRFTIRYRLDISTETRVRYDDVLYRIEKLDNPEGRNEYLVLFAQIDGDEALEANQ